MDPVKDIIELVVLIAAGVGVYLVYQNLTDKNQATPAGSGSSFAMTSDTLQDTVLNPAGAMPSAFRPGEGQSGWGFGGGGGEAF
ncbi:MAG: hypothetical protein P4K78_10745 [Terracidiphilus sp.]|nr:hypothetical protein [Terracidiphilus sp.]